MNRFENWFCGTYFWRRISERRLLPRLLAEWDLGDHVLEVGAGPGGGTEFLRKRTAQLTCLESDPLFVNVLRERYAKSNVKVVQGDAAAMPFGPEMFTGVIATFVLHHLQSAEAQDAALREIWRVLRPGGIFLALEVPDGRLMRLVHRKDTYVPVQPRALPERLTRAGFVRVVVDLSKAVYQFGAVREAEKEDSLAATRAEPAPAVP